MPANIAITRGEDRYDNVRRALRLLADPIDLRGRRGVLIKPNLVSTVRQLAATHADAIRAMLEFVRARYDGPVVIAEGAALAPTFEGYERFGYIELARQYEAQLVDLNACETVPAHIYDRQMRTQTVRLAKPVVESDFRISVNPPKTHNDVIVTLSIKNMVLGTLVNPSLARPTSRSVEAVIHPTSRLNGKVGNRAAQLIQLARMTLPGQGRSDKLRMHQGYPLINLNIALLAPRVWPHLTVIDGFQGMEGNGPNNGDAVDWHIALAGTDALAVDVLTAYLMGFDPAQIGYLTYCHQLGLGEADIRQMSILGGLTLEDVRHPFRPHADIERQGHWQLENADRWLTLQQPQA